MPYLALEGVGVDFAVYQTSARSLKKVLLRSAVGGFIGTSADSGRVVVRALQDIQVELRAGDRLALLGHNGSGKTTLLRTMAGIYHPTAGRIRSVGRRVPLFDIHLGFDEEATGYENILLRGLIMGFTRAEIDRKVAEIAEFSGLGDFLELPVRTYSSGMTLRLLFSIATSAQADILLMDEWIATGDKDFVEKADRRLRAVVDQAHILVLASHDLTLLRSICNRAVLLEGGKISFDGIVDDAIELYLRRQLA